MEVLNERCGCESERALSQRRGQGALEKVGRGQECDGGGEEGNSASGREAVGRDRRWGR